MSLLVTVPLATGFLDLGELGFDVFRMTSSDACQAANT